MKQEELEERLLDVERVLALQGKRLEKLEEQPAQNPPQVAQAPGCSTQFEELKALLKRHDLSVQALQIYTQIASFRETITRLPKELPVRHHHHFEDRARNFILGGMACLLMTAVSTGLCFRLYQENGRLEESDTKYRMIRQTFKEAALWADSVYYSNPEQAEQEIKLLEAQASTQQQQ